MTLLNFNKANNTVELTGDIGFSNVMALQKEGETIIMAHPGCEIDLSQVDACNVACLAMLVSWKRLARSRKHAIHFKWAPSFIEDLSRVHGVYDLLFG